MKDGSPDFKEWVFIALFAPILALLFGAIYFVPVMHLTKQREPWFTLTLALCLAITVFGLGYFSETSLTLLCWVYLASIALLLLVRFTFGLRDNLEHFAMVHQGTLVILLTLVAVWHARSLS
jgi:hypothetical protein